MSEGRLGAHDRILEAITACLKSGPADDEDDHDEREAQALYEICPNDRMTHKYTMGEAG